MILCSAFFSFRWRELGLCSRFLNWSKAETHGVSISFFFFFSLITQFASDPHEWARRMLGDLTMHGPQYADRTCWVHFFRFFSLFFFFCITKNVNEQLIDLYRYILIERGSKSGGWRKMAVSVICWWWSRAHQTSESDWSSIELGRLEEEEKTITLNWIRTNT